jgi:mxaD protein
MATARVNDELDASIDEVWELVKDFGDLGAWAPDAEVLDVEGEGIGAIRRVQAGDGSGAIFRERCEAFDPEGYSFSYAVLESPIPMRDYVAVVKLAELGPKRCGIEWSSEFEPVGAPEAELVQAIQAGYGYFIGSIKQSLAKR